MESSDLHCTVVTVKLRQMSTHQQTQAMQSRVKTISLESVDFASMQANLCHMGYVTLRMGKLVYRVKAQIQRFHRMSRRNPES